MTASKVLAVLAIMIIIIGPVLAITYLIVGAVKHLIWYNADCQFRFNQYQRALKTLDDLEEDINRHKNYDWTKEPEEPSTNARPGSDAHYAAWREERMKQDESRE